MNGLGERLAALPAELTGEKESADYASRLWMLLGEQAVRYTMGESTSIPEETALELLESIVYTLDFAAERSGLGRREALRGELGALLAQGQKLLFEESRSVKRLWQRVRSCAMRVENVYYASTLKDAGAYFARYDPTLFAHRVCADLDYPLMEPVPDTIKGMSYMRVYFERLNIENRIVNAFDPALVDRLLCACVPEYKNAFFNICSLTLANAAGLSILRKDPRRLDISEEERELLAEILERAPENDIRPMLKGAAERLCRDIGRDAPAIIEYAERALEDMRPRILEALHAGDLSGIFVSFLPEGVGTGTPI